MRKLHSLNYTYIKGPLNGYYKTGLFLTILGPPSSNQELLKVLLDKHEDDMGSNERGDYEARLTKLEPTLHALSD